MPKALSKIKKLQRADDATKKRWLFGATAISMIFVITLWIFYLNMTLPNVNKEVKNAEVDKENLGETFKNGFRAISGDFQGKFDELKSQFNNYFDSLKSEVLENNEFLIEPTSTEEFQPTPNEAIPPTTLP